MKRQLLTLLALHLGLAAVLAQPVITNQPANQTNLLGTTAMFTVGATGTEPLSYQWRRYTNSTVYGDIPGATNATLLLPDVTPTSHRFVGVVTDGTNGTVLSRQAQLLVVNPPTIQPANPGASLFADVQFTSTVTAAGPATYQWLFNGAPIAGAVTNTLSVTNIQKTNAGDYALAINYTFGAATSRVSQLRIVPFNALYCFGFSWTDTRGGLHGCISAECPSSCYWQGRFANGPMWPEYLSTTLGLAYAETNNYAVCNSAATSTWALNQINSFPAPPNPQLSAYFVWLATDEITAAMLTNQLVWDAAVQTVMLNYSNTIHRLYTRGARQIVVEGTTDLSVLPRKFSEAALFGTDAAGLARYSSYLSRFNGAMYDAINANRRAKPDLRVIPVDAFSKLNEVVQDPAHFGFTKATVGALSDPTLADKSFTGPGSNYVFWDGLHGTAKLNEQVAAWHMEAMTNSRLEEIQASLSDGSARLRMNHLLIGRDYTLQRSTDLSQWSDIQTFTAAAGTNQVTQPLSAGTASVFYRLHWQP